MDAEVRLEQRARRRLIAWNPALHMELPRRQTHQLSERGVYFASSDSTAFLPLCLPDPPQKLQGSTATVALPVSSGTGPPGVSTPSYQPFPLHQLHTKLNSLNSYLTKLDKGLPDPDPLRRTPVLI